MVNKLRQAEATLDETINTWNSHSAALLKESELFMKQQSDIDRRLLILTQSDTSDDAISRFDSSMQSLQRLDVAKNYLKLLIEVENLRYERLGLVDCTL